MRRSILCLTFYLSILSVHAQITKGNWLIGGAGQFDSYNKTWTTSVDNINAWKAINMQLSTNVGYFILDKLNLGLKPSFSWQKSKQITSNAGDANDKIFSVGPYCRYYFLSTEHPYNVLLDVSYLFGTLRGISGLKGSSQEYSALAGPVLFVNNCISIELLAGYHHMTTSYGTSFLNEGVQVKGGFQIHLEPIN